MPKGPTSCNSSRRSCLTAVYLSRAQLTEHCTIRLCKHWARNMPMLWKHLSMVQLSDLPDIHRKLQMSLQHPTLGSKPGGLMLVGGTAPVWSISDQHSCAKTLSKWLSQQPPNYFNLSIRQHAASSSREPSWRQLGCGIIQHQPVINRCPPLTSGRQQECPCSGVKPADDSQRLVTCSHSKQRSGPLQGATHRYVSHAPTASL